MATETAFPKCVQRKLDELAEAIRCVEACAELGRICDEVAAEFPGTVCCMPNVGTFTHYVDIKESLEEVVPIIRAYRKRGVEMIRYEDRPSCGCREYYMKGLSIYVTIPKADEGATTACKFVKVGTKTVEQPVYEIRCEGK